jgi:dual specificity tyrosine-phosphorylation-regulated kinase 2/3/4
VQGLVYLKHCEVVHCDLKPENILYEDETTKNIKLIDFGSSSSHGMNTFSYVQSRFYRAPEVLLGVHYDY